MNKSELVAAIAKTVELPLSKIDEVISTAFEQIAKVLSKGDGANFIGFGNFSVKKRAARTGRNPKTGEPLKIKAKKVPHFSAGKALKEKVNH